MCFHVCGSTVSICSRPFLSDRIATESDDEVEVVAGSRKHSRCSSVLCFLQDLLCSKLDLLLATHLLPFHWFKRSIQFSLRPFSSHSYSSNSRRCSISVDYYNEVSEWWFWSDAWSWQIHSLPTFHSVPRITSVLCLSELPNECDEFLIVVSFSFALLNHLGRIFLRHDRML